jgi:hypothetical protein
MEATMLKRSTILFSGMMFGHALLGSVVFTGVCLSKQLVGKWLVVQVFNVDLPAANPPISLELDKYGKLIEHLPHALEEALCPCRWAWVASRGCRAIFPEPSFVFAQVGGRPYHYMYEQVAVTVVVHAGQTFVPSGARCGCFGCRARSSLWPCRSPMALRCWCPRLHRPC